MKWPIEVAAILLFLAPATLAPSQLIDGGPSAGLSADGAAVLTVGEHYPTLAAALAECPLMGCVVYDGVRETFDSNPFTALPPKAYAEVHLLRQTWTTNAEIVVPTKSQLYGSGRGDAGSVGTVIQAGPGFPASAPVIEMASSNPAFAVRVENLTVDCRNVAGAIGIRNRNSQEQSSVSHALILNCPGAGLDVEGSGAQNSGPYTDLELLDDEDCTNCGRSTNPIAIESVPAFRGIYGATVNSDGAASPDAGAEIDSAGTFSDLHFEHVTAGIVVGSKTPTSAAMISNVHCSRPNTDCVKLSGVFPNQNITIVAIAATGTNVIVDELHGNTLSVKTEGGSVGIYAVGNGRPSVVFTTSASYKLSGTLVTTNADSDDVAIPGMTPNGHCSMAPLNAAAAADASATFISAKAVNRITISHPPNASRTWDIECKPN